jgi:hypothetical protein
MSTWRVYVHSNEIHVAEQVNFSPAATIPGQEAVISASDNLEFEYPDNSRGEGHVIGIDENGLIIEVGENSWLLRHATEDDVPYPGDGEPWFVVAHIDPSA